jgi:hypothetical protein
MRGDVSDGEMEFLKLPETVADPDFSRIVMIDDIGPTELILDLRAGQAALEGVASRLGLERLEVLSSRITVRRRGRDGARVSVDFSANLVQCCVLSLEEVPSVVSESFSVLFGGEDGEADDRDIVIDPLADDPPEALLDRRIDVGELVVQHLSLMIDPYPRAQGAVISKEGHRDGMPGGEADDTAEENPFAVLKGVPTSDDGDADR